MNDNGLVPAGLTQALEKMRARGVDDTACRAFAHYYHLAATGATGLIPEDTITPLDDVERLTDVDVDETRAHDALARTVIVKLNGGLGTSMGLDRAKTLLRVRDGQTFLDLIVAQVRRARARHGVRLPLLFLNSFRTQADTLTHLKRYPDLAVDGLPLDFLQSAQPKLRLDDLTPIEWPADPSLEWCPPGHGEVYTRLASSGLLEALMKRGYQYLSIANGDNLGAAPDPRLAGWFAASGAPYAAEVCQRTANDRKGGHLARRRSDGQLILRDTAQTPPIRCTTSPTNIDTATSTATTCGSTSPPSRSASPSPAESSVSPSSATRRPSTPPTRRHRASSNSKPPWGRPLRFSPAPGPSPSNATGSYR